MARVTLKGVPPFDGTYDLDDDRQFNGHELHLIKQVAGLRLGEIEDGLAARDYDLIVVLAAISVWRAGDVNRQGVHQLVEKLLDADAGSITVEDSPEAASPPEGAPLSGQSSSGAESANSLSSSPDTNGASDVHPETIPLATGLHG